MITQNKSPVATAGWIRVIAAIVLASLPVATNAQDPLTPETHPFGYYYKGQYIALDPSPHLVAMSGEQAEFTTFATDRRLARDALSDREVLLERRLSLYRIPSGVVGPQRMELDTRMLEFARSSGEETQPVFERGQSLLIPSNELIVRFEDDTALDAANRFFEARRDELGIANVEEHRRNTFKLTIDNASNGRVYSVCQALSALDGIEFAEPNHIMIMLDSPMKPSLSPPPDFSGALLPSELGGSAFMAYSPVAWTELVNDSCEGGNLPAGWTTGRWNNTFTNAFWNTTTQRSHAGGGSCYATGGGSQGVAAPGDYPNNAFSWLDTGALNLAGFEEVYVELWFFAKYQAPGFNCNVPDLGAVGTFDPATNATNFFGFLAVCYTGDLTADPTTDNGWRRALFRVPPNLRDDGVNIRFVFASDAAVAAEGLYIDEIRIVGSNDVDTEVLGNDTYGARHYEARNSGQIAGLGDNANDMEIPEAWNVVDVSQTITVAVIDSGVDLGHADLNLVGGFDPDGSAGGGARGSHGTAVAGNVGAAGNNNLGVLGMAPDVRIMPVWSGSTLTDAADAIDVAVANGADILTNSWGWVGAPSADIEAAIQDALNAGVPVLFAAGNGPDRPPWTYDVAFPASMTATTDVIAVGASSPTDEHKAAASSDGAFGWGSSYVGDGPDVVAPSPWSYSTDLTGANGYNDGSEIDPGDAASADYTCCFGGTSSATPKTAGVVALMLSVNPNLTPAEVKELLMGTADDIDAPGYDDKTGAGRVNAFRATVPTVRISTSKTSVEKGEPFDVTVTGTAPFGLTSIWWFGQGTDIPGIDQAHWHNTNGEVVATHTWTGVTIDKKGTFTLAANARDVLYANPGDGFPHQASEGAGIETTDIRVTPLGSEFGLLLLLATFGLTGQSFCRRYG